MRTSYRTYLLIANQFTQQIPEDILDAILENVGSQIAFQLGIADAEMVESKLSETVIANDLTQCPKFNAS